MSPITHLRLPQLQRLWNSKWWNVRLKKDGVWVNSEQIWFLKVEPGSECLEEHPDIFALIIMLLLTSALARISCKVTQLEVKRLRWGESRRILQWNVSFGVDMFCDSCYALWQLLWMIFDRWVDLPTTSWGINHSLIWSWSTWWRAQCEDSPDESP